MQVFASKKCLLAAFSPFFRYSHCRKELLHFAFNRKLPMVGGLETRAKKIAFFTQI